ncbi:MAG: CPBP family glutamic-type intramembrane protease [Pelobium sp.]
MNKVLNDFLQYVKKPDPFIKEDKAKVFFNQLFPLVIIALCFSFCSVMFTSILEQLHLIRKLPDFELFKLKEKKILLFFMVVVFAPIVEELIFRYQLKSYRLAILLYFLFLAGMLYRLTSVFLLFAILTPVFILCLFVYLAMNKNSFQRFKIINLTFPSHFYLTAICFGLVHISNYSNPLDYGFPIILLVLPQLFIGLILGYVRMRFGLSKSIIMHAGYNFIPALTLLAGY